MKTIDVFLDAKKKDKVGVFEWNADWDSYVFIPVRMDMSRINAFNIPRLVSLVERLDTLNTKVREKKKNRLMKKLDELSDFGLGG